MVQIPVNFQSLIMQKACVVLKVHNHCIFMLIVLSFCDLLGEVYFEVHGIELFGKELFCA